jgi:hypothetical protein
MHRLTRDRMKWGRWALLAAVLLTLVAHAWPYPYVWLRLPGAVVSLDGRPTAFATVYRSLDGQLLVWFKEPSKEASWIIGSKGHVRAPNGSSFLITARFALSKEKHPMGVYVLDNKWDLGGNPPPVYRPGYVEFTGVSRHRLRVRP